MVQLIIIFAPDFAAYGNPAHSPEQSTRPEEVALIPRKTEKYSSLIISIL
jgi:hypothetical protein